MKIEQKKLLNLKNGKKIDFRKTTNRAPGTCGILF